ncbi:four-carbon acid sugar kinase family protein [uncultured Corynebacterium sp.]|uniref:four-carbon acid sugar kinase family protein n=1 Tax=uncultured Corynebacterium sp. TaxID=159447 RepID=UPI002601E99D|nr:four-carbon acid sugar kinase family protein [uncultured Corynebacterium sp.]
MTYSLDQLTAGFHEPIAMPAADVPARSDVLIVLDDDPTGTQSVADLPVLTRWTQDDFAWAFEQDAPAIYLMTNSRSLDPEDARQINIDVAKAALAAAGDRKLTFVSRSDSTLRGHFPLEPDTLAEVSDADIDGYLIVPAFGDAGRITVGGVHYAGSEEDGFVPAAETEFAKDATFGYSHSKLAEWVEEKTGGEKKGEDVIVIDLNDLRGGTAAEKLEQTHNRQAIAVDIVTEDDLRLLAAALKKAEDNGKKFIFRVGPPFVRAVIGQDIPDVVTAEKLHAAGVTTDHVKGGLIVVGSHVPTTTRQLNALIDADLAATTELNVRIVLDDPEGYTDSLAKDIAAALKKGNVILHTSRELVKGKDKDDSLRIARTVSEALVGTVNKVVHTVTPKFVIAKGGITSSDTASKGLEMTRATVVGPMQPGIISLWKAEDGPARGIPYIVFAGNVGNDQSLVDVVERLSAN